MGRLRHQEHLLRELRVRIIAAAKQFCHDGVVRFCATVPLPNFSFLPAKILISMALLARVLDAKLLVERGTREISGGFAWSSDQRLTIATAVRMTEGQVRDLVAHIACPARVLYADPAPPYFPEALRRERAALLPQGEVRVIAGGHHLHMEDPRTVADAIGTFLAASS